jgi:hypothetical protein
MDKINYIRSIISILIVFFLSSFINNPHALLNESLGISTTKKSRGTSKQEAQFLDVEKEGEKLIINECIIQNVFTSSLFINYLSGIDVKQASSNLYEQSKPAPLPVSLILGAKRYLVKQELLI